MNTWPVVIVGGTGYVAGELIRLALNHPHLELESIVSTSAAGESVSAAFPHLGPQLTGQRFVALEAALDRLAAGEHWLLLSAAPHCASAGVVAGALNRAAQVNAQLTVADASADFRFTEPEAFARVYGQQHPAPELLAEFTCGVPEHTGATTTPHAAQPGCFATTMLLGTVPLLAGGVIDSTVFVSAVTGSTGSGRAPKATTHHPERQSNLFAYKPLNHRHGPEVEALAKAATGSELALKFVPHSGPFARGIHATIQGRLTQALDTQSLLNLLDDYYRDHPFVRVSADLPRVKDVAGSNYAQLSGVVDGDTFAVFSVLDNLVKGAAGGTIQWANRLLGLPEHIGLEQSAAGWT